MTFSIMLSGVTCKNGLEKNTYIVLAFFVVVGQFQEDASTEEHPVT